MSELSSYFRSQAEWRDAKAEEYPDDPRNAQSARALRSLSGYLDTEEGQFAVGRLAEALDPHLFEGLTLGGEQTQRAVSRYGYGYKVGPSQHEEFLEELVVICLEDAYEFARDTGDGDPTDELYPFELQAAEEGVFLPQRYFQRRSGSTEQELEEAVLAFRTEHAANGGVE